MKRRYGYKSNSRVNECKFNNESKIKGQGIKKQSCLANGLEGL